MPASPDLNPDDKAQLEETKMSFGAHLEELRRALFKSLAVTVIGFLILLSFIWDNLRGQGFI